MRKPRKILREVEKFEARKFREAGMSVRNCATYFDVSVATVCRGLADMRAKFGPEKLPARLRPLARSSIEKSSPSQAHASTT